MKFIKLTAPNGAPVWINKEGVDLILEASSDTACPGGTMLSIGGASQVVKERPPAVLTLLEAS